VNALVRNVGAAIGAQVSGTILAGSVVAGSELPAASGFTSAFAVAAGVAVAGAGLAVLVPARGRASGDPSPASVTLAGETDPAQA